jgi:hypothetical protein
VWRFFEDDTTGNFIAEFGCGPIEQAQRLGALLWVFRDKRMLSVKAFEVIDDGPYSCYGCSIEIDQDR